MTEFDLWKSFNYQESNVQLWVFKKSQSSAKFRGWHVKTDPAIEQLFRDAASTDVTLTTEHLSYQPLSQNNENSCLTHSLSESEGLTALLNVVNQPATENIDAKLKHLKGAIGYLVKFQFDSQVVYAIRKTAPTWKPKIRNSFINAIFQNGELSATPEETFSFDDYFDFYCINEVIFIKSKRAYESTTSDKKSYQRNFDSLLIDPSFIDIFVDIEPLKNYVGSNSIQLRRMTVIQDKALYSKPNFLEKVQEISSNRDFGLNFDDGGKLIICSETVKTIIQILLDHRLLSEITETIYDVPDTEVV